MDSPKTPSLTEKQLKSLEESKRSLDALFDFVIKINQIDSIPEVIWHLAQHTIKAFGFEDCVIYLLSEDNKTLRQVAAYGRKSPIHETIINPINIEVGKGVVGRAAQSKQTILVSDTRLEKDYIVDDMRRLSEIAVPVMFRDNVLGVIDSENSQQDFFTSQHQRYLEILASILASKLSVEKNIDKFESTIAELEQSKKLTEIYLEISNLTYHSRSERELYTHLHQLITKQVNTQSFYIVLYDKRLKQFSFPYVQDEHKGSLFDFQLTQSAAQKTLIAEIIQSQQSYLANFEELNELRRQNRLIDNDNTSYSWLAVPFEISKNLYGAIALNSYDPAISFTEKDKEFLNFLGQHISSAIERKFKDQKLQYQALHDQVTGLANRTLFMDRIEHAFSISRRHALPDLAVLFIDFDDFKLINDKYGHQTGDLVLRTAAKQIQDLLRDGDTLARLGGDEFAILLESLENAQQALKIAQRILSVMQKPISTGHQDIFATISIGIGLKDENTDTAEDLLKNADHAMYHAKKQGKNSVQLYEATFHQILVYERQLVDELITAIQQEQLVFYYQPIVDLDSKRIRGFEALMRWRHPKQGTISPEKFIKIAEQHDLIKAIDSQLLRCIAEQLKDWQQKFDDKLYISFNISAQRFTDSKLISEIKQVIAENQLQPGSLVVEVTEHVLMKNIGKARHLFHQLKNLNVKISLDDFGTGYSSLSYLNQLPFDILKIDRSFVTNINQRTPDHPIINMIVALANTMEIDLVAEGVETLLQLDTLTQMHCKFGQGYYFAEPLPAVQAEKLIAQDIFEN